MPSICSPLPSIYLHRIRRSVFPARRLWCWTRWTCEQETPLHAMFFPSHNTTMKIIRNEMPTARPHARATPQTPVKPLSYVASRSICATREFRAEEENEDTGRTEFRLVRMRRSVGGRDYYLRYPWKEIFFDPSINHYKIPIQQANVTDRKLSLNGRTPGCNAKVTMPVYGAGITISHRRSRVCWRAFA